jgi:hypothetical protein
VIARFGRFPHRNAMLGRRRARRDRRRRREALVSGLVELGARPVRQPHRGRARATESRREGVEAVLFDAEMNSFPGAAMMPVRLMVLDEDLETRAALLAASRRAKANARPEPRSNPASCAQRCSSSRDAPIFGRPPPRPGPSGCPSGRRRAACRRRIAHRAPHRLDVGGPMPRMIGMCDRRSRRLAAASSMSAASGWPGPRRRAGC